MYLDQTNEVNGSLIDQTVIQLEGEVTSQTFEFPEIKKGFGTILKGAVLTVRRDGSFSWCADVSTSISYIPWRSILVFKNKNGAELWRSKEYTFFMREADRLYHWSAEGAKPDGMLAARFDEITGGSVICNC